MSDQFVAEIRIVGFNFPPKGWAYCNGQLMPISQNTALFSLLGTNYGGDGKSTFALPDMQGSGPIHSGQGPGLSDYSLGQMGGTETVTLLQSEIPAHSHTLNASGTAGTTDQIGGAVLARGQFNNQGTTGSVAMYFNGAPDTQLAGTAIGVAGGGLPHNNMQPYLVLNFVIAMQGIFPPRG